MSNVKSIIQNMSGETRARAEAFASAKGLSLEAAVASQLEVELTESDLSGVVGGLQAIENVELPDGTEVIEG
ncbi:hypothetical protein JYK02_38260 [Corallococcus macrosporus]|uniref:Uncharacterized protein n=1 Tax=Corallococcus macrosporus TaxID=35 RepID=A0ABS3DQ51_9BACT|nr:hypothetical protein [Corallococcus macrosporus]MBN8233378.1 hypothetical protein [Corallococcus macrosporus]